MSTLREKRKKERRALRRRKTADWMNITVRQSRQSGVARAICPD